MITPGLNRCPNASCGAALAGGAFCGRCGTPLVSRVPLMTYPPRRRRHRWLLIFIPLSALLMSGAGALVFGKSTGSGGRTMAAVRTLSRAPVPHLSAVPSGPISPERYWSALRDRVADLSADPFRLQTVQQFAQARAPADFPLAPDVLVKILEAFAADPFRADAAQALAPFLDRALFADDLRQSLETFSADPFRVQAINTLAPHLQRATTADEQREILDTFAADPFRVAAGRALGTPTR